jgi:hypothetical protein
VSLRRLSLSKGGLTAERKSAEGLAGHDVGKATRARRRCPSGARKTSLFSSRLPQTDFPSPASRENHGPFPLAGPQACQ